PAPTAAADPAALQAQGQQLAALGQQVAGLAQQITTLGGRVDTLATDLAAVGEGAPAGNAGAAEAAARAMALGALRSAAERGTPYERELRLLASLGVPAQATDPIATDAAAGVPTTAALAARFPAVADAILEAVGQPDPDAGLVDRMLHHAGS